MSVEAQVRFEQLVDRSSTGRVNPWQPKKKKAIFVAGAYRELELPKKANRLKYCGETLVFAVNSDKKTLQAAAFCRERLCPMCAWRRTLKIYHSASVVMNRIESEHKNLVPLFLTLTVKNCPADQLGQTIDRIFGGWRNLVDHYKMKKLLKGWFRALEVTYNPEQDTYHPHLHNIIYVDKKEYIQERIDLDGQKTKTWLMTTNDWVKMWRTAADLDYDPICDIRVVDNSKGQQKSVAEVAKYTLKDGDLSSTEIIATFDAALKNRRLFSYGRLLSNTAKLLKVDKPDDGDLVRIDEAEIRADVATMIEVYKWDFGLSNYFKVRTGDQLSLNFGA